MVKALTKESLRGLFYLVTIFITLSDVYPRRRSEYVVQG